MRYLKTVVESETESAQIKSFALKNGGIGSERFRFGTVYISQITITTTDDFLPRKGDKISITLYAGKEPYESVENVEGCTIANMIVYSSTKNGSICTINAYGSLYFNDPIVAWGTEESTMPVREMMKKIEELTGKDVVLKGSAELETVADTMMVKRITDQPTVKGYLAQMAESFMGYAYETVAGEYAICHGCPTEDTTGMESNVLAASQLQTFSVKKLTCVTAEAYTDDDGAYTAEKNIIASGEGDIDIKYRGYTTTQEQFNVLATDILKIRYTPGTVTMFGNPLLEPCDAISYVDSNGDTHFTVCVGEITQTFDGGLQTEIIAPEGTSDADQQTVDEEYVANETEVKEKQSYVKADKLEAVEAAFKKAYAEAVKTDELDANIANLGYVKSKDLESETGKFGYLKTKELEAEVGKFGYLKAQDFEGENARFKYAEAEEMKVVKENVEHLTSDYGEFVKSTVEQFEADDARIKKLDTDKLSSTDADLKYANIDFSNIGKAAMEYFYSHSGLIENVVIGDATISGELVGVTFKGDMIIGNTVVADKLVIKGEDGLYYKLNTDGMSVEKEQTDYNSLNGQVIRARTITASKIDVDDLVAFGATIAGFNIRDHALYSGVKSSVHNTTRGLYFGDDGQIAIGDANNFIKFYIDQNGQSHLAMSADEMVFGSTGKTVEETIEEIREEVTVSLYIVSSKGNVFKNTNVSTVLSVVLYKGKTRIEDATAMKEAFGENAYLQWKSRRDDDEDDLLIPPEDERISDGGFTFKISPNDVDTKGTYSCVLES